MLEIIEHTELQCRDRLTQHWNIYWWLIKCRKFVSIKMKLSIRLNSLVTICSTFSCLLAQVWKPARIAFVVKSLFFPMTCQWLTGKLWHLVSTWLCNEFGTFFCIWNAKQILTPCEKTTWSIMLHDRSEFQQFHQATSRDTNVCKCSSKCYAWFNSHQILALHYVAHWNCWNLWML